MEFFCCGTIAVVQHRDSFVADAFATQFCPAFSHPCWNRSLWYGVVSFCGYLMIFEVFFRGNVSAILMLRRAGGHQLVHGPGLKYS